MSLIRLTSFIDINDKNSQRERRFFDSKATLFISLLTLAPLIHINGEQEIGEVRITR